MTYFNCINFDSSSNFIDSTSKTHKISIALLIIAIIGACIILGIGLSGLGTFKGWWSGAFSSLGQVNSFVMIGFGVGGIFTSSLLLALIKYYSNQKETIVDGSGSNPDNGLNPRSSFFLDSYKQMQAIGKNGPIIMENRYKQMLAIGLQSADITLKQFTIGLDAWIREASDKGLDEDRLRAGGEILSCYVEKNSYLLLAHCKLSSLPPEIHILNHVEEIFLDFNCFQSFPQSICQLINLKRLEFSANSHPIVIPKEIGNLKKLHTLHLCSNQLICLPEEICLLKNLKNLSLVDNPLASLPQKLFQLNQLRALILEDIPLRSLPIEINQLNQLDTLILNGCQLTSLPNELLALPSNCVVFVQNNLFSSHVIENLQQAINHGNYHGPRIHFSMPRARARNGDLTTLLKELSTAANMKELQLPNLEAQNKQHLTNWVSRLYAISGFETKQQQLAHLICNVLLKAEKEEAFRETFWNCLQDAYDTCGDRMALSIIYLDINFQIQESLDKKDWSQLAYLIGHGTWALDQLSQIAQVKADSLEFVDEIEVLLAYPIKLKKELHLPILLDTMLYFDVSAVTDADLKKAADIVKSALSNRDSYCHILTQDETWKTKVLQAARPSEYAEIAQKYDTSVATTVEEFEKIVRQFQNALMPLTLQILDELKFKCTSK